MLSARYKFLSHKMQSKVVPMTIVTFPIFDIQIQLQNCVLQNEEKERRKMSCSSQSLYENKLIRFERMPPLLACRPNFREQFKRTLFLLQQERFGILFNDIYVLHEHKRLVTHKQHQWT